MSDEHPVLSWHTETVWSQWDGIGVTTDEEEEEEGGRKIQRNWQTIPFGGTLANSTILIKWDYAEELSLWLFSGDGILPKPSVWQERNSMLFNTDFQPSATNISFERTGRACQHFLIPPLCSFKWRQSRIRPPKHSSVLHPASFSEFSAKCFLSAGQSQVNYTK